MRALVYVTLALAAARLSSGADSGPASCDVDNLGKVDATGFATTHGKLRVEGTQLVSAAGVAVQLTGLSSHGQHFFPECYSRESITFLAENEGMNLWRIAMYVGEGGWEVASSRATLKAMIVDQVQICKDLGIYVMIDWHVLTPGDPNAWLDGVGVSSGLAVDFWQDMATLYKDEAHVLYETANEPNGVSWTVIKQYHDVMVPVIRAIDPDTIIILGTGSTCYWNCDFCSC